METSKRHSVRGAQRRVGLAISAKRTNPDHTSVVGWPGDDDKIDSADLALFPCAQRRPSALIKCGLGNASDDTADAFLELIAGPVAEGKYKNTRLVFLSMYNPVSELRDRCEAAGVEVVSVMLRRAPDDISDSAEAKIAEDAFDQSNP